ncbi:MAG TPA: SMP-30/gluconolactonase/LRE family protein, partial [Hellea balneolensis]|nr:SMP-30/gluconolactonase/LRE family protein [Hellea balneolensis]
MIKKLFTLLGFALFLGLAYLLFWPVPIDPVAWDAPENPGYTGKFAPNTKLANLDMLPIGKHHGPEDVAGRMEDGKMAIYTSSQNGDIIRIDPKTKTFEVYASTGGSALGLDFDPEGNLIVADAFRGLWKIDKDRKVTLLTDKVDDGSPIAYADELA